MTAYDTDTDALSLCLQIPYVACMVYTPHHLLTGFKPFDSNHREHYQSTAAMQVKKNLSKMPFAEIMKKSGLLEALGSIAFPDKDCHQRQCISLHLSVLKTGLSFHLSITTLEALGPDVAERVRKDKQKSRISNVLQNRISYVVALKKLSAHKVQYNLVQQSGDGSDDDAATATAMVMCPSHGGDSQDLPGSVGGPSGPFTMKYFIAELYGIASDSPFELMGLDSVLDTLSRHMLSQREWLDTAHKKMEKVLLPIATWKDGFDQSDTKEAVLEKAAETILKMEIKGNALKSQVDMLSKDHCLCTNMGLESGSFDFLDEIMILV